MRFGYVRQGVLAVLLLVALMQPTIAESKRNAGTLRLRSDTVSVDRLTSLANSGNSEAQYLLGTLYESGIEIEQNYERATKLYNEAARQGLVKAQYHLALLYEIGEGFGRDFGRAAEWHRQAADSGFAPAQNSLARLYLRGLGVEQDAFQAHMWSSLAAAAGFEQATSNRTKAAQQLSSDQLERSWKLAEEWMNQYAERSGRRWATGSN